MKKLIKFFKDEDGGQMAEYVIVLGLIALAAWGAYETLGGNISDKVEAVGDSIASLPN